MNRIEQGQLILLSYGEYADYSVRGIYRATISFNPKAVFEQFKQKHALKHCAEIQFAEFLVEAGLLEDINSREWHLGDYGFEGMTLDD